MCWGLCTRVAGPHLPLLSQGWSFLEEGALERRYHFPSSLQFCYFSYCYACIPGLLRLWCQAGWLFSFCLKHHKTREAFISQENTYKSVNACRPENCSVKTNTVEHALIGTGLRLSARKTKFTLMFCTSSDGENCLLASVLCRQELSSLEAIKNRPPCRWAWQCFVWITHLQHMLCYFCWLLQCLRDFLEN